MLISFDLSWYIHDHWNINLRQRTSSDDFCWFWKSIINCDRNFIRTWIGGKLVVVNHNPQSLLISFKYFFCVFYLVSFKTKTTKILQFLFWLIQLLSLTILTNWKHNWSLGFDIQTFSPLLLLCRVHLLLCEYYFYTSHFWRHCRWPVANIPE